MTEDESEPLAVEYLILALAERFEFDGIPTRQAQAQAFDMLGMAMEQTEDYLDQICLTYH